MDQTANVNRGFDKVTTCNLTEQERKLLGRTCRSMNCKPCSDYRESSKPKDVYEQIKKATSPEKAQAEADRDFYGIGPMDAVNPLAKQVAGSHYMNMAIQPVEFCQKNKLKYCEANIVKYVCRHEFKNGIQDLKKAKHYLELLIEINYKG